MATIAKPETGPTGEIMRRMPSQERGQQRVQRLLDAAAKVIAEQGIDGATTNAIAARAHTSVGSLYQFFPHKDAIVFALANRFQTELVAINAASMDDSAVTLPTEALMTRIVRPMAAFFERNPAYRHVFHAMNGPAGRPCADTELKRGIRSRIEGLIGARAPHIPRKDLTLHATVAMEVVHALLAAADVSEPPLRQGLVRETIRVMTEYMNGLECPPRSRTRTAKAPAKRTARR